MKWNREVLTTCTCVCIYTLCLWCLIFVYNKSTHIWNWNFINCWVCIQIERTWLHSTSLVPCDNYLNFKQNWWNIWKYSTFTSSEQSHRPTRGTFRDQRWKQDHQWEKLHHPPSDFPVSPGIAKRTIVAKGIQGSQAPNTVSLLGRPLICYRAGSIGFAFEVAGWLLAALPCVTLLAARRDLCRRLPILSASGKNLRSSKWLRRIAETLTFLPKEVTITTERLENLQGKPVATNTFSVLEHPHPDSIAVLKEIKTKCSNNISTQKALLSPGMAKLFWRKAASFLMRASHWNQQVTLLGKATSFHREPSEFNRTSSNLTRTNLQVPGAFRKEFSPIIWTFIKL